MRFFISKCIILWVCFFNYSFASPCTEAVIKNTLIKMKINPAIKTNHDLLSNMAHIYGEDLTSILKTSHPFIKNNPSAKIDEQTLTWLNEMIWRKENKLMRYLYIPASLSFSGARDLLIAMLDSALTSKRRTIPIFKTQDDLLIYHDLLKIGNEQAIRDIIRRAYPLPDNATINTITREFITHFRQYNDAKIGMDFSITEKPVIEIVGHSKAGSPHFAIGNKIVPANEMIDNMIEMDMPPHVTLKLMGCFTGCSSNDVTLSKIDIEDLFLQDKLYEIYNTNSKESFMTIFIREIRNKMPHFRGRIDGYIGSIASTIFDNVLTRQGTRVKAFPAIFKSTNGNVLLKREDARITYISPLN